MCVIEKDAGVHKVIGELTFETVPSLINQYPEIEDDGLKSTSLTVDLSGVVKADSAGLALLVEWVRKSNQKKSNLSFINVPSQIVAMAELCDLDEVLPSLG
jgi:phospholipid transport system transporter-binding protein